MSKRDELIRQFRERRPKSLGWWRRAQDSLGGGVGHDLRHFEPVPLYIERTAGGRKWDVDGNEYIDFLMGNGALLLGHAAPEVIEAITAVAPRGTHFGNDHPLQIEWAELIQKLVPSAERVRFVNSGTEGTQLAIRLARAFAGRPKLLRFEAHFHGWHDGVVHGFQPPFDREGSLGVPPEMGASTVMIPDGDVDLVQKTLEQDPDIAAAIIEPSGASWGRVPLDPEFLRGLREVTRQRNVVLIFDEVVSGFRFHPGGAQERYGVRPDLSCFAKVVAGGLPGGAVVGRADIMRLFDFTGDPHHDRFERVTHLGTFNAAPVSAAAGIAVLKQVATGEPTDGADARAAELRSGWNEVLERHGIAGYAYGPSSTFHVYFETNPERVRRASTRKDLHTSDPLQLKSMSKELIDQYQLQFRLRGLDIMSSTGGVVSAVHTERDVAEAVTIFEDTVVELKEEGLVLCL